MSEGEMNAATERAFWAAFGRVRYIGPIGLGKLREHFGSLEYAWRASGGELRSVLNERAAESLVATRTVIDPLADLERITNQGIAVLTLIDPDYPRLLKQIAMPPPVLYVRGTLCEEDVSAVSVVGTRRMSSYGREVTTRLASGLAEAGVTVVSGLALGVDGAAHSAALKAGGRTIAVLGSGVDVIYPYEHRALAASIIEQGAIVSDYAPGTKPDAMNFPPRNRIISGLSLGVVVVEAPNRSGALITVDFAADQGREVFVVPGSILSEMSVGPLRLAREGARIITSAADVLDDLGLGGTLAEAPAVQQALPMTDDERRLYALVTSDPTHIDELLAAAHLDVATGLAVVTMLELKGSIRDAGAKHFVRSRG